jgi:hypothetical protein
LAIGYCFRHWRVPAAAALRQAQGIPRDGALAAGGVDRKSGPAGGAILVAIVVLIVGSLSGPCGNSTQNAGYRLKKNRSVSVFFIAVKSLSVTCRRVRRLHPGLAGLYASNHHATGRSGGLAPPAG